MMNRNAYAITLLCSHLCVGEGVSPLEPREWSDLAQRLMDKGMEPASLPEMNEGELTARLGLSREMAARLRRLADRGGSLSFELEKYENMGIVPLTRADPDYPVSLKRKLGNSCPPLFYAAGDLGLSNRQAVGYVGSRTADGDDAAFTRLTVRKTVSAGYAVVSGGAKGIDSIAGTECLSLGGRAVYYLADSLLRALRQPELSRAVREGRLLLLSVSKPDAGFRTGIAMMRNRYIYAHSTATVAVRADEGKGGTWAGATDCLKHGLCPVFCRRTEKSPGNAALIRLGAHPIDETWDGDVTATPLPTPSAKAVAAAAASGGSEQISMFDDLSES